MPRSLLSIPPELLVHILAFLPIQPLLRFSQTCRYAHFLASSSLHTLSLGIHPSRVSCIIARLAATQYPRPKRTTSFFSTPNHDSATTSETSLSTSRGSSENSMMTEALIPSNDPYKVCVLIPDAQTFDHTTLLTFHTALTTSILTRHGNTLRNLHLSLMTLTTPIAKALAALPALRALSIRIEDIPNARTIPRTRAPAQRLEERSAWSLLTGTALWAMRLDALRIEGSELDAAQLSTLLRRSRWCRELWLCKCAMIDGSLWSFLGSEWEGRTALRILGVLRCGGSLDEGVLGRIDGLKALQFLTLQGCLGLDSKVVERRNREVWGIDECVLPQARLRQQEGGGDGFIEVDPAYLDGDEL